MTLNPVTLHLSILAEQRMSDFAASRSDTVPLAEPTERHGVEG